MKNLVLRPADNPLAQDLDEILRRVGGVLEELRGKKLFITGGTGFFGVWLHECLAWANQNMNLGVTAVILTRNPERFHFRFPHFASNPTFRYQQGDVLDFAFPEERFTHVIHAAATSAESTFANEEPLRKFDLQAQGARRVLDFAVHCGAEKFLFTSSGCVYGKQVNGMTHIPENCPCAPDSCELTHALGHGKRAAEFLCTAYAQKYGFEVKILRGFCFVGPFLQMDIQYAIGNFIRDALAKRPIRVQGDGTPRRSYLYSGDMMVWLWMIFLKGQSCLPYNTGSEHALSIAELAEEVRQTLDAKEAVEVVKPPAPGQVSESYVPCTLRARQELGLEEYTSLRSAIQRTAEHYGRYSRK